MRISVSAPKGDVQPDEIDRITKDLEKIERRLKGFKQEVSASVRINNPDGPPAHQVTLELDYGRNHLIAKAVHADVGQAVREAREEILRQINDRGRRGHSWFKRSR